MLRSRRSWRRLCRGRGSLVSHSPRWVCRQQVLLFSLQSARPIESAAPKKYRIAIVHVLSVTHNNSVVDKDLAYLHVRVRDDPMCCGHRVRWTGPSMGQQKPTMMRYNVFLSNDKALRKITTSATFGRTEIARCMRFRAKLGPRHHVHVSPR